MVAPDREQVGEDTMAQGLLKDLIDKAELKKMAGRPKESFPAVTKVSSPMSIAQSCCCWLLLQTR